MQYACLLCVELVHHPSRTKRTHRTERRRRRRRRWIHTWPSPTYCKLDSGPRNRVGHGRAHVMDCAAANECNVWSFCSYQKPQNWAGPVFLDLYSHSYQLVIRNFGSWEHVEDVMQISCTFPRILDGKSMFNKSAFSNWIKIFHTKFAAMWYLLKNKESYTRIGNPSHSCSKNTTRNAPSRK